ncbi:MAG: hypothetical protein WDA71_02030 [Actinomycetota bacterium]
MGISEVARRPEAARACHPVGQAEEIPERLSALRGTSAEPLQDGRDTVGDAGGGAPEGVAECAGNGWRELASVGETREHVERGPVLVAFLVLCAEIARPPDKGRAVEPGSGAAGSPVQYLLRHDPESR